MMIHAYRSCFRNLRISLARNYASSSKLVDVSRDDKTGVSIISMSRAPVNGLNRELLVELERSLKEAQDERRRGVVLTSSLSNVFSGGLDIMEMFKKDAESMSKFWSALQDLYLTLYGLSVPIAAAINGSSPAGGCFLAMCCEYRVFVDGKHTIGLNETNLGIVAPKWFQNVMIATIGHRNAELALLRGTLFSPQEALRIGLVDELATDKADAISKCENYIASFARIPGTGRYLTKLGVRQELIQWMHDNREVDVNSFVTFAQTPEVQKNLELYVKSLKKR
ncbi:enoyl-CoA delta isomerase 1, mitochondrial-like isoform X2 [Cephus cinctus]|nr:enoyl-CoA delta isomerase 1, mitochondrial-like isoform X2 [Cephus cinctus]